MPKVVRSVQYRYLDRIRVGDREQTLEELLRNGLAMQHNGDVIGAKARVRIADLDQSGQVTLLNDIHGLDAQGYVAGELLLYRQGFDVPAIAENLDSEDSRFTLSMFKTDGKNKPVVGALYFAVIGDHVGVIASKVVTSRWLERYLTWLMKERAEILGYEDTIELNASISIAGEDPSRGGPAKAMTLRAAPVGGDGAPKTIRKERASGKGGTVLEVLRLLGIGEDAIDSIQRDIPKDGKLEGDFQVYIKEGRSRRDLSAGTLDHAFRNVDPDDLNLIRPGSRTRGKAMFLSEPVRVAESPVGLDPDEAVEQIVNQLYKWAKLGTIKLGQD